MLAMAMGKDAGITMKRGDGKVWRSPVGICLVFPECKGCIMDGTN